MFGLWIEDARKAAVGREEERLFIWNLKTQVTVWGTSARGWSEIEDYANREQAGLLSSYYLERCVTGNRYHHVVQVHVIVAPL